MNPQKLEAVERLISYSGLEAKKAREYLEKNHWNVDAAYRQYKSSQMAQSPFHSQPRPAAGVRYPTHQAPVNTARHSVPFTIPVQHTKQQPVAYAKPMTTNYRIEDGLGMAMTGMGPAVTGNVHPAFLPPQPVQKFPVDGYKERIVPIQLEKPRAVVDRAQPVPMPTHNSIPPHQAPTSNILLNNHRSEPMPKSQSFPVPVKADNLSRQSRPDDNTHIVKAGFVIGDRFPGNLGGHPQPMQIKGSNPVFREEERRPENDPKLSAPKSVPAGSSPKVLKRGISKISQNAFLVDEERKNVLIDIAEDCHDNMYIQTFVLPDISGYSEDFKDFLEKDLIEMSTLVSLEQAGRLNWWAELSVCQRLLPMATSGDGNCLLHAASLAMWGIHDRQLMLRKALYDTLTKKYYRDALYRRWRLQQTQANKEAGLIFSEEEWRKEWENVLRLASTTPRSLPGTLNRKNSCCDSPVTHANQGETSNGSHGDDTDSPVVYESLEEFHVFVLAHVIQRPIIVVADTILRDASGEAMAPIPFGGIYMPVECDPSHCYRSPLLLTYDAAHFSALVPMETSRNDEEKTSLPIAIPIVSTELATLPLHFAIDPGIHYSWEKNNGSFSMPEDSKINLLKKYMDVEKLPICGGFVDNNSDKNSTGSYESDDGLIEKGKKKDKKGNSVSKQFGSFGKSVGKKLKNLGKGSKDEKKGLGSGSKNSNILNSRIPLTISALAETDQQSIWCCKLTMTPSDTHQKMIDNYLYDAGVRFKSEMASPRIRRKDKAGFGQKVKCVTSGCSMYGTANTSYLCSKCYNDQKKVIFDQEKDRLREFEHNKHEKHDKHGHDDVDITRIGKSKFYDMAADDTTEKNKGFQPKLMMEKPKPLVVDLNSQPKGQNSNKLQAKPRPRTPSPDYDNVEYKTEKQKIKPTNNQPVSSLPPPVKQPSNPSDGFGKKCLSPDCDFYGSEKTNMYCSGCYKKKTDLRQV